MASIIDYILEEDKAEYMAIIERAAEAKANAPKKERAPRAPLTNEQKIAQADKRIDNLKAKLAMLRAAQGVSTTPVSED